MSNKNDTASGKCKAKSCKSCKSCNTPNTPNTPNAQCKAEGSSSDGALKQSFGASLADRVISDMDERKRLGEERKKNIESNADEFIRVCKEQGRDPVDVVMRVAKEEHIDLDKTDELDGTRDGKMSEVQSEKRFVKEMLISVLIKVVTDAATFAASNYNESEGWKDLLKKYINSKIGNVFKGSDLSVSKECGQYTKDPCPECGQYTNVSCLKEEALDDVTALKDEICRLRNQLDRCHTFLSMLCRDGRCDDHCSACIDASDLADDVWDALHLNAPTEKKLVRMPAPKGGCRIVPLKRVSFFRFKAV